MRIEQGKTYCGVLAGTLDTIIFKVKDDAAKWEVPAIARTEEVKEPDPVTGQITRQVRLQLAALTKLRLVEDGVPAIAQQHFLTIYEADDELTETYRSWISDWKKRVEEAMQQRQKTKAAVGQAVQQLKN